MLVAVMSDIHGNHIALQACISHALAHGAQHFIFLGDYLGECPFPQKTMQLLFSLSQNYACRFIRGNKEDYWVTHDPTGSLWQTGSSTTGMLHYVYSNLTARDISFFGGLPIAETVEFSALPPLLACHGSPTQVNEALLPGSPRAQQVLACSAQPMVLCGHTHRQGSMSAGQKRLLNPGSVGMPLGSGGKAQFLLLQGENVAWQPEFFSVDYDIEHTIAEMHAQCLFEYAPCWARTTEYTLRHGTVSHGQVLALAMQLCRQQTGDCTWPNIPESCWQRAADELLI